MVDPDLPPGYSTGDLLSVAVRAARVAGDYLRRDQARAGGVTTDLERDVKLDADRRAEDLIMGILTESRLPVLTEERGFIEGEGGGSTLRWVVDPLDGSVNYATGIPLCAVSIALWCADDPLLGTVYDFERDELFTGIVGFGAWLNQSAIHASRIDAPERAVLCTGFPVSTDFSPAGLLGFVEQVRRYKKVRLLGSAALSLAYVAMGRADAYHERDIKIWDVAAGLAVVLAAGGAAIWSPGSQANSLTVFAGASSLPRPSLE